MKPLIWRKHVIKLDSIVQADYLYRYDSLAITCSTSNQFLITNT